MARVYTITEATVLEAMGDTLDQHLNTHEALGFCDKLLDKTTEEIDKQIKEIQTNETESNTDANNSETESVSSSDNDGREAIREDDPFDESDVAILIDVVGTSRSKAIIMLRANWGYLSEPLYTLRAHSRCSFP
jgi:hypothetical protein